MAHSSARLMSTFVAVWCLFVFAAAAEGADQTEYLRKTPQVLEGATKYIDATTGDLPFARARSLVDAVFEEDVDDPDFYCVIHVLVWGEDANTVAKTRWYLYRGRGSRGSYAGRWDAARFNGSRAYGTDRMGLLYVHLNVPGTTRSAANAQVAKQLAPGIAHPTAGRNFVVADLLPEQSDPDQALKSERGGALKALGDYIIETAYANITYQIDVVKKLPAPIQNLQGALGLLQAAAAPEPFLSLQRVAVYAADTYDILHVPSDITVTGKLTTTADGAQTTDLGKQSYDNEGLYYWDVSLGIPMRSISELDFETSGGEVFAKEVDKSQLMALMNIYWRPVDTKNTKLLLIPSPIIGVALSTKPLEKVMAGLSIGLNRVQFFAGYQWAQVEKPPTAATDATVPEDTTEYKRDVVFGINVPVRQVVDFLKGTK